MKQKSFIGDVVMVKTQYGHAFDVGELVVIINYDYTSYGSILYECEALHGSHGLEPDLKLVQYLDDYDFEAVEQL